MMLRQLTLGAAVMVALFCAISCTGTPSVQASSTLVPKDLVRDLVVCEFDKPISNLVLVMHWYDNPDELNLDYMTFSDQKEEEVWGWADCEWNEENDIALCDVYAVLPTYVHADMNIDTLGHEALHGACGGYHD